jgi:hypothetical protein
MLTDGIWKRYMTIKAFMLACIAVMSAVRKKNQLDSIDQTKSTMSLTIMETMEIIKMNWDRFDICEAYLAIEMDWNVGGMVDGKSYSSQLLKMRFRPSPLFNGYESLTENGKEIYLNKVFDLGFIDQSEWENKMDEFIYGE